MFGNSVLLEYFALYFTFFSVNLFFRATSLLALKVWSFVTAAVAPVLVRDIFIPGCNLYFSLLWFCLLQVSHDAWAELRLMVLLKYLNFHHYIELKIIFGKNSPPTELTFILTFEWKTENVSIYFIFRWCVVDGISLLETLDAVKQFISQLLGDKKWPPETVKEKMFEEEAQEKRRMEDTIKPKKNHKVQYISL